MIEMSDTKQLNLKTWMKVNITTFHSFVGCVFTSFLQRSGEQLYT